jgi:hypothetical protein
MSIWERSQQAMAVKFSQALHEKQGKNEGNSDSESDTELPDLSKSEADLKLEQVIFMRIIINNHYYVSMYYYILYIHTLIKPKSDN